MAERQVYEGKHYDGEYLISSETEKIVRDVIGEVRLCRRPARDLCPYCEDLIERILRQVGANLYAVAG